MLTMQIIKGRDCGMTVYRLVVFHMGSLRLVKTHMSAEGCMSQWLTIKSQAETASTKV